MIRRLILITPRMGGAITANVDRIIKNQYPPIFSILEAMSPNYEVKTYHKPTFIRYEKGLVGISPVTASVDRAYKIADKFRKKGARVIMGGPHVMFNTKEALNHCDSVIVGEVEKIWEKILKDYENDKLKKTYYGEPADNFWEYYHEGFLKLPDKKKHQAIQTTRGCKFNCKFCMTPVLYKKYRHVPVEKVVEQVKSIKGLRKKMIYINDDNIFSDPEYAKRLFRALIPLNIRWGAPISIDIARDKGALDLAKKSGANFFGIGFETVNRNVIKNNPGKLNLYKEYLNLIKRIKKKRIPIRGFFMYGFDGDDYRSFLELIWFTLRANIFHQVFTTVTPFKGTPLFKKLKKERRIISFNWKKYNTFNTVIRPKNLTSFELTFLITILRLSYLFTTNLGRILLFFLIIIIIT